MTRIAAANVRSHLIESLAKGARLREAFLTLDHAGYLERLAELTAVRTDPSLDAERCIDIDGAEPFSINLREEVSGQLFVTGVFEYELAGYIVRNLADGDTFVDVGAHYGYFTRIAARVVGPAGHVLAVEPIPLTFERLCKNTRHLPSVVPLNIAAWNENTTLQFNYHGDAFSAFSTCSVARLPKASLPSAQQISVKAVQLDDIIEERGLSPTFIKIDVEDAELTVLHGLARTLKRMKPRLAIEVGDLGAIEAGNTSRDVLNFVMEMGYDLFDPGILVDSRHSLQPIGRYGYGNVIAVHCDGEPLDRRTVG